MALYRDLEDYRLVQQPTIQPLARPSPSPITDPDPIPIPQPSPTPTPTPTPTPDPTPDPTPTPPHYQDPYQRPDWFRSGVNTYLKTPSMSQESGIPIKQDWWRDPQWGGHVAWNPYWGFQDRTTVQKMYEDYGEAMPWDVFTGLGLTQQPGPNWQQYFPEREPIYAGQQQTVTTTPTTGTGGGAGKGGIDPSMIDPSLLSSGQIPFEGVTTQMLQNFGYTGNVPINPYEQMAMQYAQGMAQSPTGLQTMAPAQSFYNDMLAGLFGPQGEGFKQDVYEATKTGAMQNLSELQKDIAEGFAHRGGYFGGKHAIAQSDLANKMGTGLNEILANLNYSAWQQDMANRMGSAQGLAGMGGQQQNILQQNLGNLWQAGDVVTGREALNRAEWQRANEAVYNDWLRARNENLIPFQMALSLMGMSPFQPVVQQPQQSPWSALLGGFGSGLGMGAGTAMGKWF